MNPSDAARGPHERGAADNRLGPWEVTGELGRGAQGAVLRARHVETGAPAAIKLLLRPDERSLRRFKQEAAVLSRLSHPNLVRVLDQGERAGAPYLVMELVEGQSLSKRLEEQGPPPFDWTARTLAGVAGALEACHAQGVVHRDLKPENVIIERSTGRPVLVDFGLVRRDREVFGELSIDAHSRLSRTGELRGTPAYMAPEQVSPGKYGDVGPRTDVHALGAVLHVMLTGQPPYKAESLPGLVYAILDTPPPDPRALNPAVPEPLRRLCLHALRKLPAERPASAAAFARALLEAAAPDAPALRGRGRAVAVGLALAAVAGAAVALALLRPAEPERADDPPPRVTTADGAPTAPADPPGPALPRPALPIARSPGGRLRLTRVHGAYGERHVDQVWAIAVSPDGRRVLSGTGFWHHRQPGTLQLREPGAGEELRAWRAHRSTISGVAFTADGRRGLSGGYDGLVHLWDLERPGRPLASLPRGEEVVSLAALPAREDLFLVARRDGEVSVVHAASERLLVALAWRVPGPVSKACPMPDGRGAVVDGAPLVLLDLDQGATRPLHDQHLNCAALVVSPDGRRLLAGCHSLDVYLFDLAAGRLETSYRIEPKGRKLFSAAWLPDSRRVLVGRFDGRTAIFDPATREDVRVLDAAPGHWGAAGVGLMPGGRRALLGVGDRGLRLHDLETDRDLTAPAPPDAFPARLTCLAVSGDGARAIVGCFDHGEGRGTARVVDLRGGGPPRTLATGLEFPRGVGLDPTGRRALVGCTRPDPRVQRWDLDAGARLDLATGFDDEQQLTTAALSPDGRVAVAGSDEGRACAWRLDQELPLPTDLGVPERCTANDSAFSPDGGLAVLAFARHGGERRSFLVQHDVAAATTTRVEVPLPVTCLAVLPGGAEVVVGASSGELERRGLADGARRLAYPAHAGHVQDVALSPDGTWLASAAVDGVVRLSDARTGAELDALDLGLTGDRGEALAFLPDGATLLVATTRGVLLQLALGQER